jgi:hypothetical protein
LASSRRLQTSVSTAAKAKTAAYAREEGYRIIGELGPATTNNKAPDQQYKYCAHDRSNESRTLIRAVPPDGLTKVRGNERANDAQDSGENKALRLIITRRD